MEALAWLLSLIVQPCYALTGNWWIAILLFTLIVKVILLPMSLLVPEELDRHGAAYARVQPYESEVLR